MAKQAKINITIIKEDIGYGGYTNIGSNFIATQGDTFAKFLENVIEVLNFTFEDEGKSFTMDDIQFDYDLKSFFEFYKVINVSALSKRIGMNQSLLAQYIKGYKTPSKKQTKRIIEGVNQIGKELTDITFVD